MLMLIWLHQFVYINLVTSIWLHQFDLGLWIVPYSLRNGANNQIIGAKCESSLWAFVMLIKVCAG